VFFTLDYQSRVSKHKNWKELKTFKNLFKSNKEELAFFNSFQKLIFNEQSAAPPEDAARGPGTPSTLHKGVRKVGGVNPPLDLDILQNLYYLCKGN